MFADRFCDPDGAIAPVCVCVCVCVCVYFCVRTITFNWITFDLDIWLVHFDTFKVKFEGQGHKWEFKKNIAKMVGATSSK